MGRAISKLAAMALLLVGLPLLGLIPAGIPVNLYLEFPPHTSHLPQESFSYPYFFITLAFLLLLVSPFIVRGINISSNIEYAGKRVGRFPWWGIISVAVGIISWILAWSRFPFFAPLQRHTFTPLWLSYIFTVNALTFMRSSTCLFFERRKYFLSLFPLSSLFWWFFEFLNRFVHNWYYTGAKEFGPLGYIFFASISFSTVLPAVLSTREFLLTFPLIRDGFRDWFPVKIRNPRMGASLCLLIFGIGLGSLGVLPDYLYPLLWVSPLGVIISLQVTYGENTVLSNLSRGDWTLPISSAFAALICGFFWEMWNFYSLAKWSYSIPHLHGFRIFEMPLIGYGGYIPFGLECAAFTELFHPRN